MENQLSIIIAEVFTTALSSRFQFTYSSTFLDSSAISWTVYSKEVTSNVNNRLFCCMGGSVLTGCLLQNRPEYEEQ